MAEATAAEARLSTNLRRHIGEILAIRQILGHPHLPEFVGDIERRAPYREDQTA